MAARKNIVILGSSGSIGESALDVIRQFRKRFRVIGLSVNSNVDALRRQVKEFRPDHVAVADASKGRPLGSTLGARTRVHLSSEGVCQLAGLKDADLVLVAIVGSSAVFPLLSAISAKKTIALANKEAIVVAGELVLKEAKRHRTRIIPIDSEQSAIFQCLEGRDSSAVGCVYLTASGGPLVDYAKKDLARVSVETVLAHPRWKMGRKITVDSATLMNKGLEVIEAQHLFGLPLEKIKVIVHREALIHSMVEFRDGSLLAQMAMTDMRLPIQYALTYPERWPNHRFRMDPLRIGALSFAAPDRKKFPCLDLAYEAGRMGGLAPCALNAANEVAVDAFLNNRLAFGFIPKIIEKILRERGFPRSGVTLKNLLATDTLARRRARQWAHIYGKRGYPQ